MSKNKSRKSRKQVKRAMIIALLFFSISVAFIIVCGLLSDNGYGTIWWPTIGILGFFLCNIVSLRIMSKCFKDSMYYENQDKKKKYNSSALHVLKEIDNVNDLFIEQGFVINKYNYLFKKKYSLVNGPVYIYIKSLEFKKKDITTDNLINLVDENIVNSKNSLSILFINKDQVNEADLIKFKDITTNFAISGTAPFANYNYTIISVLVDKSTNIAYFLDTGKIINLAIYGYGCRFIKRSFK